MNLSQQVKMFTQHLIIIKWAILNLKQTFGSLEKCVLLKVTHWPSGYLKVHLPLSEPSLLEFLKCALEIESTTILKAVCLRQDLRSETGSGYFLMRMLWTSLLLLEVMESNADTHKVSHCNWIENYRAIKTVKGNGAREKVTNCLTAETLPHRV